MHEDNVPTLSYVFIDWLVQWSEKCIEMPEGGEDVSVDL